METKKKRTTNQNKYICRLCGKDFSSVSYHVFYCETCRAIKKREVARKFYLQSSESKDRKDRNQQKGCTVSVYLSRQDIKKIYSLGLSPDEFVRMKLKDIKK